MNFNGNGKRPLRERFAEFMYGRNGIDNLYHFLFWSVIGMSFINLFISAESKWVLTGIQTLVLIYTFYRVFSRNVYRRQKENQIYMSAVNKIRQLFRTITRKVTSKFALSKNKWRDRKTHVYKKCPQCKNTLRFEKVKGKHIAACPCCDHRFEVKIR